MESFIAELQPGPMLATLVYSIIGIVIFLITYFILDKFTPFSIRKEIEEDHNVALGIIIGAVFISLALIISAAIRG